MNIAVVADTKDRAVAIADDLGLDRELTFGSRSHLSFEGLIADLVLIDSDATIPEIFMQTIYGVVIRRNGKVRRISLQPDI